MIQRFRNPMVVVFLVVWGMAPAWALDKKKAAYVGGSLPIQIPEKQKDGILGSLNTIDDKELLFAAERGGVVIKIPYHKIDSVEYGQKANHRIKTAILLSPIALFSKKRHHYLNIFYKDGEGKDQAVVFEVGSELLRNTVVVMEVRSGKKISYQDEESKKNFGK